MEHDDSLPASGGLYARGIKRILDVFVAVLGLVTTAPLMLLIAAVLAFTAGRPILFRQIRPGKDERLFTLMKFRSMRPVDGSRETTPSTDAQRLTRIGALLRKSSLDELPQLFNILRGDMSVIGPRPLAVQYLDYYTDAERLRHSLRPGITGLAQVMGRNTLQWEERFAYDLEYVQKLSLLLDLKILGLTIRSLSTASEIQLRGAGTVTDFDVHRQSQWRKGADRPSQHGQKAESDEFS